MAKSAAVWGIEVGQSALKALQCSIQDGQVVANAFDYVEYPKILSQPEAVPEELIAEAMATLLDRNEMISGRVCISVPGQSGLAKFFKPPPVELKKLNDIVRYEARQQIPFDLNDVIWDYQMMPGSTIEDGYAFESEVGLFAMKRDQAYKLLAPFEVADIEVDVVQLAPLALYNMVAFDRMHERIENDTFDAANPPPSTVVLSIGTDSSDLLVTNGFRIWQRSMPIGGNHFTRQLTKDLKLTFAKAEHLKRNAREAVDPKLIFQTMRPVFNDLVTEVQRSIGFYRSLDKKAVIGEMLITGNTVKMPGLAAYLGKNLGFEVHILDRFNRLGGEDVLSVPTFVENAPTFAVCYGLCLQGLEVSQVHTSLVPQEIKTARMIRAKKPWTLVGIAALLMGMAGNYWFQQRSWLQTHPDKWKGAQSEVANMAKYSTDQKGSDATVAAKFKFLNELGTEVSGNAERRLKWLEVMKTINEMIPRPDNSIEPGAKKVAMEERQAIHITSIDTKHFDDVSMWFTEDVAKRYRQELRSWAKITSKPLTEEMLTATPPKVPGWVFEMHGYHYYNSPKHIGFEGSNHVRNLMTTSFLEHKTTIWIGKDEQDEDKYMEFTAAEMGISFPLLLNEEEPKNVMVDNPDYDPDAAQPNAGSGFPSGGFGGAAAAAVGPDGKPVKFEPPQIPVRRLDFIFQFVWIDTELSVRIAAKEAKLKEEADKAKEQTTTTTDTPVASNP